MENKVTDLHMLRLIADFPIGKKVETREELLAKASLVSTLSTCELTDIDKSLVDKGLSDLVALEKNETMFELPAAERILGISSGFTSDYGKVQYIKEHNTAFDETFSALKEYVAPDQKTVQK